MGEYIPRDAQDRPINPAHCKAATPSFVKGRFFQCQRKAAGYCWQHQPERVAERAEKSRQHRESSLSGKELRVQRDALLGICERFIEIEGIAANEGSLLAVYNELVDLYDEAIDVVERITNDY